MIDCTWCKKRWKWDWCQDTIVGLDPKRYVDGTDTDLYLFVCSCGGSLCVVTEEPNGSQIYNNFREEE